MPHYRHKSGRRQPQRTKSQSSSRGHNSTLAERLGFVYVASFLMQLTPVAIFALPLAKWMTNFDIIFSYISDRSTSNLFIFFAFACSRDNDQSCRTHGQLHTVTVWIFLIRWIYKGDQQGPDQLLRAQQEKGPSQGEANCPQMHWRFQCRTYFL